jgi:acetyl esterase/lipase
MLDKTHELAGVRRKVAALGYVFNPDVLAVMRALYAPLARRTPASVRVIKDVAYGPDLRHRIDVYRPADPDGRVVIYIPGGGFVGGGKDGDDGTGPFYANIGNDLAGHGILTVIANYRLAPAHVSPAGAQDVAAVAGWVRANAAQHGGDPRRVVLWGQSAGTTHCATYLFDSSLHAGFGAGLAAAILMSGPYKVEGELPAGMFAYFGSDTSTYEARSPLTRIAGSARIPLLLSVAEYDPGFLAASTYELALALTRRDGKGPHMAWFAGHNHVSTVMSFGTAQDDVASLVRSFVAEVA